MCIHVKASNNLEANGKKISNTIRFLINSKVELKTYE
jgi:hypothetical protein